MADFKSGDVVQLASGGPKMTVQGTVGSFRSHPQTYRQLRLHGLSDDQLVCKYWDESAQKFQTDYFRSEMLKLFE